MNIEHRKSKVKTYPKCNLKVQLVLKNMNLTGMVENENGLKKPQTSKNHQSNIGY